MAKTSTTAKKAVKTPASTPPVSVDKTRAGHLIHSRVTTHAQPDAECHGRFDANPPQIGIVEYNPAKPVDMAETLMYALRAACQNAHLMGATEIRIKLRRKWYDDVDKAR